MECSDDDATQPWTACGPGTPTTSDGTVNSGMFSASTVGTVESAAEGVEESTAQGASAVSASTAPTAPGPFDADNLTSEAE